MTHPTKPRKLTRRAAMLLVATDAVALAAVAEPPPDIRPVLPFTAMQAVALTRPTCTGDAP